MIHCYRCGLLQNEDPRHPGYPASHLCFEGYAIDFNDFFERITCAFYVQRMQLIVSVAQEDSAVARRNFQAYSPTARLRVIVELCTATDIEVQ